MAIVIPWPADLGSGTITGRVLMMTADRDDEDRDPDMRAGTATVTVQANAARVTYTGAEGPALLYSERYETALDAEGYICTMGPNGQRGPRGIILPATDSDLISPTDFTYTIEIRVGGGATEKIVTDLPAGSTRDIAVLAKLAPSSGTTTIVDVSVAERAEVAADRAQQLMSGLDNAIAEAVASAAPTLPDDIVTAEALAAALAGVQVDTSGLATVDQLQGVQAAVGERPTRVEAERIALENALLNEDQPVTAAKVEDGTLVLVRRDGVELAADGQIGGGGATVRALSWEELQSDPMWFEQDGGWVSKNGQIITLCVRNAKLVAGARLTPSAMPGGSVAAAPDGGGMVLDVILVDAEGTTVRAGSLPDWHYDGAIFVPGTRPGTSVAPEVVSELRITWATTDTAPLEIGEPLDA